jgi:hypothetical protein
MRKLFCSRGGILLREKIRKNLIFTKLSIGAYCVALVFFLCPLFIPERILNGAVTGSLCIGFFIAGMLLQGIQLLFGGLMPSDLFFISEPLLTEEDVEELKKYIEEFDKEENKSPLTLQNGE